MSSCSSCEEEEEKKKRSSFCTPIISKCPKPAWKFSPAHKQQVLLNNAPLALLWLDGAALRARLAPLTLSDLSLGQTDT